MAFTKVLILLFNFLFFDKPYLEFGCLKNEIDGPEKGLFGRVGHIINAHNNV